MLARAVGIQFGMWSTILLLGSAHGLVMALLLLRVPVHRAANRALAALLFAVVLRITPYTLGYAGFYDAFPWLSFAPFDWRLAYGPLVYLYVRLLFDRTAPRRWAWHFAPAAALGAYYLVLFCAPLSFKDRWNDAVQVPWIVPFETWAGHASMATYWVLAWRRHARWQRWLVEHSAAREELRLGWLRGFLVALAAMTAVALGFDVVELAGTSLDYFDRFPLYLAFTALVYYLGLEGWRNADRHLPQAADEETDRGAASPPGEPPPPEPPAPGKSAPPERDWRALGQAWQARVRDEGWWREPELSLHDVARRLGTNTRYLSRAFNEGLGHSFSELVNRLRVEEARRLLAGPDEVLAIALRVGFASKASFNRAFKAYAGCTPTELRAGLTRTGGTPSSG